MTLRLHAQVVTHLLEGHLHTPATHEKQEDLQSAQIHVGREKPLFFVNLACWKGLTLPACLVCSRPHLRFKNRMRQHRISALPVVRGNQLVGIITERHFLNIAGELLDESFGGED